MGVNVYYSPKRNRKYVRKFDYYEAQERWRKGEPASKLAEEYGVSVSRIYQVASPKGKAAFEAYQESLKKAAKCVNCGKAKSYVSTRLGHLRCQRCASDDHIVTVRPSELKCGRCQQWLPDDVFGLSKRARLRRRGRWHNCRECEARDRRERRHRAVAEGRARTKG